MRFHKLFILALILSAATGVFAQGSGPDPRGQAQSKNPVAGLAGIDYTTNCNGGPCVQEAKVDSSGNVSVTVANGASGGTSAADESTFTEGSTSITPFGCYYKTSPVSLTTGQTGAVLCTATRHVMVSCDNCSAGGGSTTPTDAFANPTTAGITMAFLGGYNGSTWDLLRSGDKNNVASITGILNTGPVGRYNATQPTLTDTRYNFFQLSSRGELLVAPGTSGFPVTLTSTTITGNVAVTNAGLTNLDVALSTIATASNQTTGNTSLSTIATNSGLAATAANQTTGNTSLSTIATNSGLAATAAKQDTGNTSLSSIDGKTPALGQALASASVPVILPSATITTLTPPSNTGYALDSSLTTIDTDIKATQPRTVTGNVASGGTDSGNPVKVAGVANTISNGIGPLALQNGQRGDLQMDSYGRLLAHDPDDAMTRTLLASLIVAQKNAVLRSGPFNIPVSNSNPVPVQVIQPDPCSGIKQNIPITQAANAKWVIGAGHRVFICNVFIVAADAENLSLVEGTGSTCGTGTLAVIGGATAANGPNFAANGGWVEGNGGASVASANIPGDDICLFMSGSGRVAGNIQVAFGN